MTRIMGASGAESLNVAASIFMGQTEAPVTIRPFLPDLTRSELMTVMTSGMAHVSGSIMAAYFAFGAEPRHVLSAVIMTAPGTILISKMLVPETEQPKTAGRVVMPEEEPGKEKENLLGAIARGTGDGLHMALNIGAMLIAFIALIHLVDGIFGGIHNHISWFPETVERVFRIRLRADCLGDRHSVARLRCHRKPVGHAHGPERTGCLHSARPDESHSRSAILHHRDVRTVRLRQFQFDWNSDWRHRSAWPRTERVIWPGSGFAPCSPEPWPT